MYMTINGYNYTVLNAKTKKANDYMRRYSSNYGGLYNNYKSCSSRKQAAWEEICRRLFDVRITGAGSDFFSCAGILLDKETGKKHFVIETPSYSYIVENGYDYYIRNYVHTTV